MAQPQQTTQPADPGTQPAPRRRRLQTPTWMQRPPIVICAVLLVVVVELAAYALLGWLWWLVANLAVVLVAWCGVLAWRRKGKGGLLDRVLGALFPGRGASSRTSSKTSRASGGKGGPMGKLFGGGRGKGAAGGSGKSGRGGGPLGKLFGGRGKSAGGPGGGKAGKGGPLGKLLGGKGPKSGKGSKPGGSWWPFSGLGSGGAKAGKSKGGKPGGGKGSKGGAGSLGQLGDALGLGGGKSTKNKTGKSGKSSGSKGGKSAGGPWWKTLWDQGKAGVEAAIEDDAERQRRRADKRAQRAGDDDQGDEDDDDTNTNTRSQPAAFAQPPRERRSKGDTQMYTEGASLFRFGRNLPQVSAAIQEHAAEARKHEEGLAETVKALKNLASQADTELPADKAIVAEIESIRARAAALLADPQSAKLARLAAEAEALPGKYQSAHSEDEARLAGRRGGVAAEKRADVSAGEADT